MKNELKPASLAEVHALWRAGILVWKLWDQQLTIYDTIRSLPTTVTVIVILCCRQFGKSVLSLLMAIEDCLQNENIIVLIVAPDVKQAQKIVRQRMKLLTRDAPKGLIVPIRAENRWEFPTTGSSLVLGGYNANASSERGQTLHKVVLEEFGPDTDADGYLEFIRVVGLAMAHSTNAQLVFPTTLPTVPDHPFITETIPEAQSTGSYFEFTLDDNHALTPEQKAKMIKLAGGRGSVECERELFCKQVRDPTLVVVPSYDEKVHVREFELPPAYFACVTGDQGGTRDKTCWLLHCYDFLSDRDLIIDEIVAEPNTPSSDIIKAARAKWGVELGDINHPALPDGTGFDVALDAPPRQLVDMGADVEELAFSARLIPDKSDWQANVNQMADRFRERVAGEAAVWVHTRCTFLRLSLRSGTLNKLRNDFARSRALGHCDGLAALMYALRTAKRDNPYPAEAPRPDRVFRKPAPDAETATKQAVADAIQQKTFGPGGPGGKGFQPKRFGKFKG